MHRRPISRSFAALAVVAALATPGLPAAHATPTLKKPSAPCNTLPDKTNDADLANTGVTSPLLDIVSADVATGAKTVSAVLRVGSTQPQTTDPIALVGGVEWHLSFHIKNDLYEFLRTLDDVPPGSYTSSLKVNGTTVARQSGTSSSGSLVVTTDATSIKWTVPRALVTGLAKPHQVLTQFGAHTAVWGASADYPSDAHLWWTSKYPDRGRSCVATA